MRDTEFFAGVPQHPVTVAGCEFPSPTFYYDFSQANVVAVTPLERIRELLPSPRLYPLRLTPRSGVTVIVAYEYRDSDIGPYNEVAVGFPVTVDRNAPVVTELRRFQVQGGSVFIWQLPVTTAIARDLGVEVAGYPKFLADIDFGAEGGLVTCRLAEGGRHILTLRLRHRSPRRRDERVRYEPVTVKGDRLLRGLGISNIPRAAVTFNGRGVELELGDHPLAERLRRLEMGRVIMASYAPANQLVLAPPLESWPLARE
jgi:Acetoacetate decarboxylase (ADC)